MNQTAACYITDRACFAKASLQASHGSFPKVGGVGETPLQANPVTSHAQGTPYRRASRSHNTDNWSLATSCELIQGYIVAG